MHLNDHLQAIGLVVHEFHKDFEEVLDWPETKLLLHIEWLNWYGKMREEANKKARL